MNYLAFQLHCSAVLILAVASLIPLCHVEALAPLEPEEGAWFGVNTDNSMFQTDYAKLNNVNPVVFGTFIQLPMRSEDFLYLADFLEQVAQRRGIAMVTIEPNLGLLEVTERAAVVLAQFLKRFHVKGVAFLIRFAHEMNGSWYPWSQMPTLYIEKFRLVARILHAIIEKDLAMLWAPNNGAGYPFNGGRYRCEKWTCADFPLLDTNGDGELNTYDDMYDPYYPGDDVVDWVGMTLYHWGLQYPWGNNYVPEPRTFYNRLTGNFKSELTDESMLPNFYAKYCTDGVHNKPMAVPETAALFNVEAPCCADQFSVKSSWWTQVFNVQGDSFEAVDVSKWLPRIKIINWFDWRKRESEVNFQLVDWTFTFNRTIHDEFLKYLKKPTNEGRQYWKFLDDFHKYRNQGMLASKTNNSFRAEG